MKGSEGRSVVDKARPPDSQTEMALPGWKRVRRRLIVIRLLPHASAWERRSPRGAWEGEGAGRDWSYAAGRSLARAERDPRPPSASHCFAISPSLSRLSRERG